MTPTSGLPCLTPPDLQCGDYKQGICCGQSTFSCATNSTTSSNNWQLSSPCPEACHVLTSPSFPGYYPSNLDNTDVIEVEQGLAIAIEFTAFDVQYHYSCEYDHLTITEGDGTPLMAKTCGSDLPSNLISNTGTVRVSFRTDGSGTRPGWRLEWAAVPPGVSPPHHL